MEEQQNAALPAVAEQSTSAFSLVMNESTMDRMIATAKLMASAKVTIPAHLRNSEGDCMAVILQSAQWKMNPYAVGQKTHLSQSGQLGYEAQLINAVIVSCGAVTRQPEFEFIGDWSKIVGKVKEMRSDKGGKYYVTDYNKDLEEGLGVICTATLRGESEPRQITVMLSQCYPRFSTQWATDPQQQITYAAVRKFARRYAPGAILGVYDIEELDSPPMEKEINPPSRPARQTGAQAAEAAREQSQTGASAAVTPEMRANAILDLETIAREQGAEEYKATWAALTKAFRVSIGVQERDRIMKIAESIQGESTESVDPETGEVSHD